MKPNIHKILDVAEQVIRVARTVIEQERKHSRKKSEKKGDKSNVKRA